MKKILIIEDDKILQKALNEALSEAGFKIILASDGDEGIQKAKSEKPDLILLDIILPGKNGYNVLLAFSDDDSLKNIPVIMLTVIDSEFSVETCKEAGVKDYLVKSDYSLDEVIKKINKYI